MEFDTGAARSLISSQIFYSLYPTGDRPMILPTRTILKKYGDAIIPLLGEASVNVRFQNTSIPLPLLIVNEPGPALFGRDWIRAFGLSVIGPNTLNDSSKILHSREEPTIPTTEINKVLNGFKTLFKSDLGTFKNIEVTLDIDPNVPPKFLKARPVPFSLRDRVDLALDSLLKDGIIEPVKFSTWACPIVPVVKPTGQIRICGDFKVTANKAIKCEYYPLPKVFELLSTLAGGKYFAKLDLSQAYNQLKLDEKSRLYTTINTHRGLFRYTRLCFGINSASGIFQRHTETLLKDIERVLVFSDDIFISGCNKTDFLDRLQRVLHTLEAAGLRLNKDKCKWCLHEINYLGFKINSEGIKPTNEKIQAIIDAPPPKNKTELQAFLGLLNFYRSFLPQTATILEPLNALLRHNSQWQWTDAQQNAFTKAKDMIVNSDCLIHYDPKLPIVLSADCSSYGIGCALSHLVDGIERPVSFASRTLSPAERNYSQLEREALAIIFALKKFHFYVYGFEFTIKTDHKPLLGIFSPDKLIPLMASGRIIRWCLMMQAYKFKLVHTSGKLLGHVDALSRLPLPNSPETVPIPDEWINLVTFLESTPVTSSDIAKWTKSDPILSKVHNCCLMGWTSAAKMDPNMLPFYNRQHELSVQQGCVLWGTRIIIPSQGRDLFLRELHSEHIGSTRMKQLSRSYFWWPCLDGDIEACVNNCNHCLETRNSPPKAELHPWMWPQRIWHRLHVDFAGPIKGFYYLVIVDATSKWPEIYKTSSLSTDTTIDCLRSCFSRFGIPVVLVSDNGANFTSVQFKSFLKSLGVHHLPTSVHSPSMNGLAERMVQTFKDGVNNFDGVATNRIQQKLDQFLFKYRVTPHSTTGVAPSELMFGRPVRTVFDLLRPGERIADKVISSQIKMKESCNAHAPRQLQLQTNQRIKIRNYGRGPKWQDATVQEQTGNVTYRCQTVPDNIIVLRHLNQIWPDHRHSSRSDSSNSTSGSDVPDSQVEHSPDDSSDPEAESLALPAVSRYGRRIRPPDRTNL